MITHNLKLVLSLAYRLVQYGPIFTHYGQYTHARTHARTHTPRPAVLARSLAHLLTHSKVLWAGHNSE